VIRFGLRLTLRSGREAAVRVALTAAAVALGVVLLLITLAGINALNAQNARAAWLSTSPNNARAGAGGAAPDPLWWLPSADQFGSQRIYRVDVAAAGSRTPVPPGIPHLPGPGQFYASPALSQLLRSTPADQLGDRFGGRRIGTIGPAALPAPNSLIAIVGHAAGQLAKAPGAAQIRSIQASPGGSGPAGYSTTDLEFILALAALALFFPLLVFIGTATRLSAARREQRFAALRLAGATPRQVSVISAVEASAAALAGVATAFILYFLLHPVLVAIPSFTGAPFAPGDLSLRLTDILLVAIGVPAAAAAAARVSLRRVQISPLGVSRRVTPPAPRAYRVIPLLAGVGELAYFAGAGHPLTSGGQVRAYFLGFLLIMAGLVIAGPWLTMAGARVLARRTSRPAMLIAGRRLSDNPRAAFRSISGLILALFITSASIGITATIVADHGAPAGGVAATGTLADGFNTSETASGQQVSAVASIPATVLAGLRSDRGVRGVTVIRTDPLAATSPRENQADVPGLISCAQLSGTPALGRCAAGADVASITLNLDGAATSRSQAAAVWPAAAISAQRMQRLPVQTLVVATNGSTAAIERARTALEAGFPYLGPPATLVSPQNSYAELQHVTDVVILVSLVIAGCSLAVSAAGGLADRRRPFSLLRLTGVQLGVLHRVIALETAVPLVVIAAVSAGTGLLASDLFLRSELSETLRPPGAGYYLIVLAGLIISLSVIASTFPLLKRITGPEAARNE
jgi:FtsX-like permease family protein